MKRIVVIILLVTASTVHAEDKWKWTKTDTVVQAGVVALMVVDWGQTLDGTKPDNYYKYTESNPILGEHPNRGRVNTYFVAAIVGHTAISRLLPNPYRRIWQAVWIAGEGAVVAHNFSVGVKVDF